MSLPPAARPLSVPPAASPASVARRARILVIDDEPAVATVLRRLLAGHDVVCETDGRAALSRIANGERYDVILCDMMMPLMSGIDVYEAIRSTNPVQASKLVFLTGGALSDRARAFLDGAINPVIHKPFSSDALRAAVALLLEGG